MTAYYEEFNPFRSPAWRANRVVKLLGARPVKLPSRTQDDRWVKGYYRFLSAYNACEDQEERLRLFPDNPGVYYAHTMHTNSDEEWRAIIQARILTNDTYEVIGERVCTLASAIEWYEKLFFNVRDRMHNKDYIVKSIIGRADDRGPDMEGTLTEFQRTVCYKLFGYYGGTMMLDLLIAGLVHDTIPYRVDGLKDFMDSAIKTNLRRKAMMMARVFSVNKFNVMQLFDTVCRIMEMEKGFDGAIGGNSEVLKNVEEMFREVRFAIGDKTPDKNILELSYDTTAVEPRADETAFLAEGQEPASLVALKGVTLRMAQQKQIAAEPKKEEE